MRISLEMESQSYDEEEEENLHRGIEKAQQMLKTRLATAQNIAEGSADAGRDVKTLADDAKHSAMSAKHARDQTTSADDAKGSTASTDEGEGCKMLANGESSDMDIDESAKDDPKVKMESEEPEIEVPTTLQGQVIDLTSTGIVMSDRPTPSMTGAPPLSADVTTATE